MNSIDCERLDSLDGWVAIKTNIFEENETFKLGFIVQWNVIESKFAVTCHNRTLQRQKRKDQLAVCETETSWAGLFSVNDLNNVHRQFIGVGDVVAPYFPDLSDFKEGNIWDMIFLSNRTSNQDDQERDLDTPCRQLEKYFSTAIDICGRKIVLDSLFPQDERDVEEYFENMQEFKRKTMQDEVTRAKDHLRKILQSHGGADRMIRLLQIYDEEDIAYQDLVTVATTFYQYLLQPFRDMRELAGLYKMEILKSLDEEELGPKRIAALEREAEEWRRRGEDAVSSIQDITVSYFIETSKALRGMLRVMEEDKRGFGQASWASAAPRLEKLCFLLAKETLQHMRATEMCLHRKKHTIREKMGGLSGQDQDQDQNQSGSETVDNLELQYYDAQLELYDAKFEILKNEELLLVAQIDTLRRQIKELKEEVVYYDVCEDPEELQSLSQTAAPVDPAHSPVYHLGRRLQQLEAKRGNICARRAYLRNKKDQCVEANELKHRAAKHSSTHFTQHHGVALKREKSKEEQQRRKEWVDQERERTLSRLRSFREKRQGSYVLKTPRSKMAAREPPRSDPSQPLSIISISPSPSSNGAAPRKTPRKVKPKDIPIQIFTPPISPPSPPTTAVPPPQTSSPPPQPPPPPPPLPPPPPPPPLPALTPSPCKTEVGDSPRPLSEREVDPFPAKKTLKQNIGSMDEVLASLQRGQVQLRRVQPTCLAPSGGDLRDSIMSAIKLGVKLRKVVPAMPLPQDSRDTDLQKSIKAAMQRMKRVSSDSDDEDEERGEDNTPSTEWDS